MKVKRLSRAELTAIIITLVLVALVCGYHIGNRRAVRSGTQMSVAAIAAQTADDAHIDAAPEASAESVWPININTASEQELQLLPGIGEVRSCSIVEYRREHGPFEKVEDITRVSGIGSGVFEDIIDLITVGGGGK
ncbi:MAG: ComEA family DNA-binding protein [Oscillospiraceae bacterium]|nr:ComEA family DNA-binding protein [Oscillospiraceae bacterium]